MKKLLIIIGVLVVAGGAYVLLSPLFIDKVVDEKLEDILADLPTETAEVATESTPLPVNKEPNDPATPEPVIEEEVDSAASAEETKPLPPPQPKPKPKPALEVVSQGNFVGLAGHAGEGTAKLIKASGKYFLRFESDFKVTNGPDLVVGFGTDGEYQEKIATLKGNMGGQNYQLPAGFDPKTFNEAWVWCRAFSVPFAKAVLR